MKEHKLVDKDDKRAIKIGRKYGLRLGTMKFEIFRLFEQGYSPQEVRYILRYVIVDRKDPLIRNISRYYYTWKSSQLVKNNKKNSE